MKKFSFCLLIFLFIILISSFCFANIDFTYDNYVNSMPDFPSPYNLRYQLLVADSPSYYYHYVCSDSAITYRYNGSYLYLISDTTIYVSERVHRITGNPANVTWTSYGSNSYRFMPSRLAYANHLVSYLDSNNNEVILYQPPESYDNLPHILNDTESLTIGGQSIVIMPGDFPKTKQIRFAVQKKVVSDDGNGGEIITYTNLFLLSLDNNSTFIVDTGGDGFYYSIPWSFLYSYLELTETYNYVLAYDINGTTYTSEVECVYGGATTDDAFYNQGNQQINTINEQTNAINNQTDAINNQTQVIEEQTQAIEGINDTITDDSIDSGASDLPSIDITDPAQAPLDNIFMIIYNAFCTGNAQDIVFPIPFTNKNITLSPYYVRDMLNNNGGSWVVSFTNMFWQFVIAFFIIKDVSKKVNKIKSGDIENIENTNIKEDML